jgi:hypothetical protein
MGSDGLFPEIQSAFVGTDGWGDPFLVGLSQTGSDHGNIIIIPI